MRESICKREMSAHASRARAGFCRGSAHHEPRETYPSYPHGRQAEHQNGVKKMSRARAGLVTVGTTAIATENPKWLSAIVAKLGCSSVYVPKSKKTTMTWHDGNYYLFFFQKRKSCHGWLQGVAKKTKLGRTTDPHDAPSDSPPPQPAEAVHTQPQANPARTNAPTPRPDDTRPSQKAETRG